MTTLELATDQARTAVEHYRAERMVWNGIPDDTSINWLAFRREWAYFRLRSRSLLKRAERSA